VNVLWVNKKLYIIYYHYLWYLIELEVFYINLEFNSIEINILSSTNNAEKNNLNLNNDEINNKNKLLVTIKLIN